ncbi:MAG: hypothetical protein NC903_01180, partial [Candidatus Omnitrophica bacterium]|nr:hypothetical protein [Candidatus Omnitrophota bacterium]
MIRLEAEKLFSIYSFDITNSYLTGVVVLICLLCFIFLITRRFREKPSKIQSLLEIFFEGISDFWVNIVGKHNLILFTFCLTFL